MLFDTKFRKLLQRKMSRKEFFVFSGLAAATVSGILGIIKALEAYAATPAASAKVEAENGTLTSPATNVSDATASGGQAITFGAATTGYTRPTGPGIYALE